MEVGCEMYLLKNNGCVIIYNDLAQQRGHVKTLKSFKSGQNPHRAYLTNYMCNLEKSDVNMNVIIFHNSVLCYCHNILVSLASY